ncbi:hypothetical protein HRbin19_00877 [bacterium HR19]|nr:hypothetical protein HRbin19_00877 [bacterium HR19]
MERARKFFLPFTVVLIILSFFTLSIAQSKGKEEDSSNPKVAVVDLTKIIQEAEAAKEAKAKLQAEYEKKQNELKKIQDEIIKMQDEFAQKAKFMSQQELEKKKSEIEAKQNDFMNRLRQAELEIQNLDAKLTQDVIQDIKDIIQKISQKEGYFLVLDKNQILYVKDADDITFRVIDEYNRVWRSKKSGNSQPGKKK